MMKNGVCKQEIKFDFSKIEGWHTNDIGSYKTGLDSLKSKPLKYNDSILSVQQNKFASLSWEKYVVLSTGKFLIKRFGIIK